MMNLKQAVDTLDGVIPPPGNTVVATYHLPIAVAWHVCKEALRSCSDMQARCAAHELCENPPLTLEELREMGVTAMSTSAINEYGKTWLALRRRPEGGTI